MMRKRLVWIAVAIVSSLITTITLVAGGSAVTGWGLGAVARAQLSGLGYLFFSGGTTSVQSCSSGQVSGYGVGGAPVCATNGGVVLGDGGAAFCAVSSLANLEALSVSSMVSGTTCFVNAMHARYYLDLANSLPTSSDPDSATQWSIVPTSSGGSTRWIFDIGYINPEYQQSSSTLALQIDPISGNDAADGFSSPFQTWKRLWYAWGQQAPYFQNLVTLTWLNDQPDFNDPVFPKYRLGQNGGFQMIGQLTTVHNGTFTTLNSRNKSAGLANTITDSALSTANAWTAMRWMMVKDTTAGAIAWVYYDNGDNQPLGTYYWETAGFTTLQSSFTQPAVNSTVVANVGFWDSSYLGGDHTGTAGLVTGETVSLTTGGTYTVGALIDKTHVVLTNLGTGASPGTTIPGCNTAGTGLQTGCVPRAIMSIPRQAQVSNFVGVVSPGSLVGQIPSTVAVAQGDSYSVVRGTKVYLAGWEQTHDLFGLASVTTMQGYGSAINMWFQDVSYTAYGQVQELHIKGSPLFFAQCRIDERAFSYDGDGRNVWFTNNYILAPQPVINSPNNLGDNPQAPWVNWEGDVQIYAGAGTDGGWFFRGGHGQYAIGGHLELGPYVGGDIVFADSGGGPVDGAKLWVGNVQLAGDGNMYQDQAGYMYYNVGQLWGGINNSWIIAMYDDATARWTPGSFTFSVVNAATPTSTVGDIQFCGQPTGYQWPETGGSANLTFANLSNSTWTGDTAWAPNCNAKWLNQ